MNKRGYAVVFDFDGTLIDSREAKTENYLEAFETVFKTDLSVREKIRSSCTRTSGANRFIQLQDTLDVIGKEATESQRQDWSRLYSKLNARSLAAISEFPSVRKILSGLAGLGFHLYSASGILEKEFLRELTRRKLTGCFAGVKGGDKLGFLRSLKSDGYWPILFAGDTIYDEKTAAEAGVRFHRVETDEDLVALFEGLTTESSIFYHEQEQ